MASTFDGFEDDDDFGEFGSFEAADPSEAKPVSADSQAAASWVIAAVASSLPQPDPSATAGCNNHLSTANEVHDQSAITKDGDASSQRFILDDAVDGTNWAAVREDLEASSTEDKNSFNADFPVKDDVSAEGSTTQSLSSANSSIFNETQPVNRNANNAEDSLKTLTELHLLKEQQQQIKEELQQELEKLSQHNALLESQRQKLQEQLDEQEQKYQLMQKKHIEELEDVRQVGQKTIAAVVEKYKELSKLVVLEQQEKSLTMLAEAISAQRERQEALSKKQEEYFVKQLETLQEEHKKSLRETIASLQEQHQKEIQFLLQEETKKAEKSLEKTVQEAQMKNLEDILGEERRKNQVYLEEQQSKWQNDITDMKKEMLKMVEKVAEDKHQKSENAIKEVLKVEREQQKETMKTVLSEMKAQMTKYIAEQRQADKKVLQHSLAATDTLLDKARQQIQMLLREEDPVAEVS